jgi:hypothetical protein
MEFKSNGLLAIFALPATKTTFAASFANACAGLLAMKTAAITNMMAPR